MDLTAVKSGLYQVFFALCALAVVTLLVAFQGTGLLLSMPLTAVALMLHNLRKIRHTLEAAQSQQAGGSAERQIGELTRAHKQLLATLQQNAARSPSVPSRPE